MEAGKRKRPGGGKAPASSADSGPTQQHPRRFVRAERRGGRGAGRGGGGRGGGRGGGNQAGSRAGPPAGGGARGVTDPKLKDKYLDFYRTLSPTIKKVAGRVLHSMPKPQLSLLTKEKVQKRTEEEIDVDLPDDEATSTPSKKKQKKSVSITETKKEERRSVKKRKLALDEEEGENGRALLVPITGEKKKKKKDEAEHQNKKRKLDLTTCDEKQEEEEEVPEKPWLTSITLYMDSPQSRLSSPIKVVRREVAWPTEHVVLPRSQAQVRSVLQKHGKGHWGPIPLSPSLTFVVEKLAKTGIMSVSQMHSYNFWLKTQQALVCHRKAVQLAPHLAQLYGSGQSIVELSAKYDLPPVSLFRAIISARDNLSKIELKRAMSEESELEERDRLELAKAREADMITTDQRPGQLANADLFEAEIEKYLRSNRIRFKRQDELTQVFINGHQVRWIDAKNYYGSSDVNMQIQSMKKQANRYVEYWGPGAIVFALSYCSELTLPASVLKLDASSFSTAIPLDAYSK